MNLQMTRLVWLLFSFVVTTGFGQINTKTNTGHNIGIKTGTITAAIPIKKVNKRVYKDKLLEHFKKSPVRKMEIPKTYLTKPRQRRWEIMPSKAFGPNNLGFSFQSGELRRKGFYVKGIIKYGDALKYVAEIHFRTQRDKTYLIRVITPQVGNTGNSYINAYLNGNVQTYSQKGEYLLLVKAQDSGNMTIPISASHPVGGNERYPDAIFINKILIDVL
ncbi:hypothetical protein [Seonamhaeicola sp.]|uniref:hypothetical protein n=1 Tax=Seonamhaeicola sp. TaxID=1912245 RepID=UPI00261B8A40|nr:hypothetical protein [Seonamhaeicola sp.]